MSREDARIRGDLYVNGEIKGKTIIELGDDITCDDIACDAIVCNSITPTYVFGIPSFLATEADGVTINNYPTSTSADTYYGINAGVVKSGASTSDNTTIGVDSAATNITATNGVNILYGVRSIATLTHAADAGTPKIWGGYFQATGNTNGASTAIGVESYVAALSDTTYGLQIRTPDGADGDIHIPSSADSGDYFNLKTIAAGVTTITTVDDDGEGADLIFNIDGYIDLNSASGEGITLDSGGRITLDSASGEFAMLGAGTTPKFADMYAGMILGYTDIGLNETHDDLSLSTSLQVPTDEFGVTFVAPPSGNVEIFVQVWYFAGTSMSLIMGLSDANRTTGFNSIGDQYTESILTAPARNSYTLIAHTWTLTGLTAGTSYSRWVGVKASGTAGTPKVLWGGDTALRYPDFIMKATALPATIVT